MNTIKRGEYRKCLTCGKEIYAMPYQIKNNDGKFCSRKCYWKSKKGIAPSGIDYSNRVAWNKGKKFPQYSGVNSPVWKGGATPEKIRRLTTSEWIATRKRIYQRDNWTCQRCGKHCHNNIQCHHTIPYRVGKNYRFIYWNVSVDDDSNLITLCKSCHGIVEKEYQRKEVMGIYALPAILHTVSSL